MKKILFTFIFSCFSIFTLLDAKDHELKLLDKKEPSIIEISAFTTLRDKHKITQTLNTRFTKYFAINEINEVLVQIYANTRFPKSLGGIFTFLKVYIVVLERCLDDKKVAEVKSVLKSL